MEVNGMKFHNRWTRVLCVASLAIAIAVPSAWALSPAPATKTTTTAASSKTAPVDINHATTSQLTAVKGIGVVYAERIIANRPYHSKYDLVTKGILPRNVYNQIKDGIVAHKVKK